MTMIMTMKRIRHHCWAIILFFSLTNSIPTFAFSTRFSASYCLACVPSSNTPLEVRFSYRPPSPSKTSAAYRFCFHSHDHDRYDTVYDNTRRRFVTSSLIYSISAAAFVGSSFSLPFANAATTSSSPATSQERRDKENLVRGYNRLQYLLDNWEDETTVCKIGQETTFGDKCERTPTKVMEYLGFKSTNDPLFKADTTMMRLKDVIPPNNYNREAEYYDAIDSFVQNSEEANSMAFVSSWGEANPGGGKDRVRLFIERSKKNVMASRDSLKTVMDILDLKP